MRTLIVLFFALLSPPALADGVDRIHVFLNGKLIFMTESSKEIADYTISAGDTVLFDAWTDWDMLDKATLSLKSRSWKEDLILTQIINDWYGAQFIYIVKEEDLGIEFDIVLNYHIPNFAPTHFLSIKNGRLE